MKIKQDTVDSNLSSSYGNALSLCKNISNNENVKWEDATCSVKTEHTQGADSPAGPMSEPSDLEHYSEMIEGQTQELSGVQRRTFRKEEKIKTEIWTREKPVHVKKEEDKEKESGGTKRSQSDSSTPSAAEQPAKKPRSQTVETGTYSEAADGLRMVVIDRFHPDTTLNQLQANLIKNKLVEMLDQTPSRSTSPPQFVDSSYMEGILWINCANTSSKDWLLKTFNTLGELWKGANLTIVEAKDLPKRPKVVIEIPELVKTNTVRSRLEIQNPGLSTEDWRYLGCRERKGGVQVFMAFSVDEASYKVLERLQFKAFFGLGMVRIIPIHEKLRTTKIATHQQMSC